MTVTVWARPACGPCLAVKAAFDAKGVPYVLRNLTDATDADRARWAAARMQGLSAPVVEYAGGAFAGFIPAKVQHVIDTCRA